MKEDTLQEPIDSTVKESETAKFKCQECGRISQDDVIFLCNTCDRTELVFKEGLYICPSCLKPGENFECMLCGSKEVALEFKKPGKKKSPSK